MTTWMYEVLFCTGIECGCCDQVLNKLREAEVLLRQGATDIIKAGFSISKEDND